jgi:hypothetical protein
MTRRTSLVTAGDGVADPDEVTVYRAWADERQVALAIEWDGAEYDEGECWIEAGADAFRDLGTEV